MVSTVALCEAAGKLGLESRLRRNRGAEPLSRNSKTLADAIEAILGAAWLDGGLPAARKIFEALDLSPELAGRQILDNPKGALQIKAQAMTPPRLPVYTLIKTSGKCHSPKFTVKVEVEGIGEAVAEAGSHKEAEALAAAKLL
jgi:ribonuclease-3